MGNNIKGKQGFQGMTHEEFIQKASQNNDKLNIIGIYKCNREKVDVECKKCGHQWKVSPSNILRNAGCPVCHGNKKKTHEEFEKVILDLYPSIELVSKYKGANHKIKARCKVDNYEWEVVAESLKQCGCPVCNGAIMTTTSFKNEIKEKYPNVEILGEWNGIKGKIKCHCKKCEYDWEVQPRSIREQGCPRCSGSKTRRLTNEEYLEKLNEVHNGNVLPLEDYVNMSTSILHRCLKHNCEYKMKPSHALRGQSCKQCAKEKQGDAHRLTLEEVKSRLFEMYGNEFVLLSDTYNRSDDKMLFQHNMPDGTSHTFTSTVNTIFSGEKCGVCKGLQISIGFNDFNTKCTDLAQHLVNYEDGFTFTEWSGKYADWKCPQCSHIVHKKVSDVHKDGICCPKCSDGISYPNKFMYNCLLQIKDKLDFLDREYRPEWCVFPFRNTTKTGFYDIYFGVGGKEYFCELDGALGHGNKVCRNMTQEEAIYIDNQKDRLAQEHNIHMVRIDCAYEKDRYEYIKNNVLLSELKDILPLDLIDFDKANAESQNSLLVKACELWNLGYTSQQIAKEIEVHGSTVTNYLKTGKKIGICSTYSAKESSYRSTSNEVICLNTGKSFRSIVDGAKEYGLFASNISKCCRRVATHGGIYNGEKTIWMYLNEYNKLTDEELANYKPKENGAYTKVVCLNTLQVFDRIIDAAEYFGIKTPNGITQCCTGKYKSSGTLPDGTKLRWMYYKDYIEKFDESTLSYLGMGA